MQARQIAAERQAAYAAELPRPAPIGISDFVIFTVKEIFLTSNLLDKYSKSFISF
jgi:hypothetical protein